MALDAVIFDWGGTLTVDEVTLDHCLDRWRPSARHLAPDSVDEAAAALFAIERAWWDRGIASGHSFTLHDVVAEAAASLGVTDTDLLARAAVAHLEGWRSSVVHDPDAPAVLAALAARGLRVGLLSNTHWPRQFHEDLLVRDRLDVLIHSRHYTCELTHLKPHAPAFQAALDGVGAPDPTRVVFVGDRPIDDISGAKAIGMYTVLRPNPHVPQDATVVPDATIHSLPELLTIVDRLLDTDAGA